MEAAFCETITARSETLNCKDSDGKIVLFRILCQDFYQGFTTGVCNQSLWNHIWLFYRSIVALWLKKTKTFF